ncbi:MAG: N-6 DNA methylase [Planctomycetota bacterium]|jgi:hypothetical protein
MNQYATYVRTIESLAQRGPSLISEKDGRMKISAALDGQPMCELRRAFDAEKLRQAGAFFTSSNLARIAVRNLLATAAKDSFFYDPACGAGDLLVACARGLRLARDYATTLENWGKRIAGADVHPEFVRAAKARLAISAVQRGVKGTGLRSGEIDKFFPLITRADGLERQMTTDQTLCVVLNPPYTTSAAHRGCRWAQGSVSTAALFVDRHVTNSRVGTRVTAILPEVLRTGTRYGKWRDWIQTKARVDSCRVFGRFAAWADVDVFLLDLTVVGESTRHRANWWKGVRDGSVGTVSDRFAVHVGPVVPHRHPKKGPWRPFLCAKMLPAWRIKRTIEERRRFRGPTFSPPFVVVRRTSRPGDMPRAVATIITGDDGVAVENHLIVLLPNDGALDTCRLLMDRLRSTKTDLWLDRRIRCRHLTVSALREIPWWSDRS